MSAGAWVAICIAAGVVGAIVTFLLTTWSFLPQERKLSETTPTVETFLPAHDIRSADINNLRFHSEKRGYDRREVDWALARIASDLSRRENCNTPSDKHE